MQIAKVGVNTCKSRDHTCKYNAEKKVVELSRRKQESSVIALILGRDKIPELLLILLMMITQ